MTSSCLFSMPLREAEDNETMNPPSTAVCDLRAAGHRGCTRHMLYSYGPSTKRWSVEYRKHKICEAKKFDIVVIIIIIIKIDSTYITTAPGNRAEDGVIDQEKTW